MDRSSRLRQSYRILDRFNRRLYEEWWMGGRQFFHRGRRVFVPLDAIITCVEDAMDHVDLLIDRAETLALPRRLHSVRVIRDGLYGCYACRAVASSITALSGIRCETAA